MIYLALTVLGLFLAIYKKNTATTPTLYIIILTTLSFALSFICHILHTGAGPYLANLMIYPQVILTVIICFGLALPNKTENWILPFKDNRQIKLTNNIKLFIIIFSLGGILLLSSIIHNNNYSPSIIILSFCIASLIIAFYIKTIKDKEVNELMFSLLALVLNSIWSLIAYEYSTTPYHDHPVSLDIVFVVLCFFLRSYPNHKWTIYIKSMINS